MSLTPTPGQTVGPFFHYALPYDGDNELVPSGIRIAFGCTAPSSTEKACRSPTR